MSAIDLSRYKITDAFFGRPFITVDEQRERPSPHRFVQGDFEDTDTEFAFYLPPAEHYTGRMFQPLEGGNGGHAVTFGGGILGEMFQRIAMSARLGGYMIESNQDHKGDDYDPRAGKDPALYGHRASAKSARLSKFVAAQVHGTAPHHSYVWDGSGGGRRSPALPGERGELASLYRQGFPRGNEFMISEPMGQMWLWYPFRHEGIDGSADELSVSTTHSYDRPGAYFSTARVTSHRDGDLAAEFCRIETIGQARTVVS